jgi:ketosteroid isomerase-like protein
MNRIVLACLLLLVLQLVGFSQKTDQPSQKQRQEIEGKLLKMEDEWTRMIVTGDSAVLERILASDYVGSDDASVRNKAEEIASYKQNPDKITSAVIERIKVHIFTRDTAITNGELALKGEDKDGKPFDRRLRWTSTYIKRNGIWQCVSAQATWLK